jgi:CheY-like chemotaxis protein/HPt (histidine-containing phosphotransfer) domain-containing protein
MQIDTAYSGKEAIGKISVHKYDVILMDHMMPELDGVETTHIIRRFHEEYQDTPIIALTANAVEGTREMFLKEGMNDFVAKPIELRVLVSKMKQWLPAEKIKKVSGNEVVKNVKENAVPEIGDLDVAYSMKLLGGEKLFWKVLKDYYRVIEKKADLLKELEQKEDWEDYTIEAHALKSASKQIGAMSLSAKAADMEQAGRDKDGKKIHACTDAMVQQYREYIPVLAPYCEEKAEESSTRKIITEEIRSDLFAKMRDALENLDMDCMEEVIEEMKQYRYQDWEQELLEALYNAVEEIDVDACEALLCQWEDHE